MCIRDSILVGHVQGNPYGGYSGGYKHSATGITNWKSISSPVSYTHLVAQAKAAIEVHEMFRSAAILQGADLANGFMGGRTDFLNATLELSLIHIYIVIKLM